MPLHVLLLNWSLMVSTVRIEEQFTSHMIKYHLPGLNSYSYIASTKIASAVKCTTAHTCIIFKKYQCWYVILYMSALIISYPFAINAASLIREVVLLDCTIY